MNNKGKKGTFPELIIALPVSRGYDVSSYITKVFYDSLLALFSDGVFVSADLYLSEHFRYIHIKKNFLMPRPP